MPLCCIFIECTVGYKFTKLQVNINHLVYMNGIKLFAKREKELETLIQTIWMYSHDRRMEFGIEKCVMLIMESGKRKITDGTELPNQKRIRKLGEKENNMYLGILDENTIKQVELKEKIRKD